MVWDYDFFVHKIHELTNIDLANYKERQMKRRINSLISRNGFEDYEDYYDTLIANDDMLGQFISYITINVSEFFRNPRQWEVLEENILPTLYKKHNKLKIWSAACSTGEEPYSLAMLLDKHHLLESADILATDIDRDVLHSARQGIYSERELEGLPNGFKERYFSIADEDKMLYAIDDRIKESVTFRQHDLLKRPYPQNCHLIICRNVMIYFTEDAKIELYKKFYESLHVEGIFFVGSTEQIILPQRYNFEPMETFFYKKMV